MKIRAKYKGGVGRHGFKADKTYTLNFDAATSFPPLKESIEICKYNDPWDNKKVVRYASLRKFLNNWDVL